MYITLDSSCCFLSSKVYARSQYGNCSDDVGKKRGEGERTLSEDKTIGIVSDPDSVGSFLDLDPGRGRQN